MLAHIRQRGFTLLEVLIVIVIMAVLAATIIPQFSRHTRDVQENELKLDLQTLRTQIELYKLQHGGSYPAGTNNLEQLTKATDVAGNFSPTGLPDAEHPLGPYIQGGALPVQPFSGRNTVSLDHGAPGSSPNPTSADTGGWIYRAATGEVFVDHPHYVNQ
ncbi:MAG: type II secretion system protein [Pirellulales bacterium]